MESIRTTHSSNDDEWREKNKWVLVTVLDNYERRKYGSTHKGMKVGTTMKPQVSTKKNNNNKNRGKYKGRNAMWIHKGKNGRSLGIIMATSCRI